MPTSSGNENYNLDNSGFLHFEPIGVHKSPIASIDRSESSPILDVEQVDVDEEISSLFAMVNPSFADDEENELPSAAANSDPKILQKIAAAQKMLTDVHFENQLKATAIEESVARVQELRHRSEKLAKFNKQQVQQVQGVLKSFEQIRQDIITALGEFGGYDQVQALLQQMGQADASLRQAQRELLTHQTDLYRSLQHIQQQVEERNDEATHLLQQQQSDLKGLLSASEVEQHHSISTANGSGQMHLSAEVQDQYEQLASKAHLIKVAKRVNKNSETIKILQAEIAESHPLKVTKRVNKNSETIKILQTEISELHNTLNQGVKQDISNLNSLYGEMTSTWSETRRKQCSIDKSQRLFQNWLMTLSVAMVIMLGAVLYQFLK
jgi:DNA repair exonuclease SbcCD ATPase subunit